MPRIAYAGDDMSLTEFMNEYPLHLYFADFGRLRGQEWFPCQQEVELFDREAIHCWEWDGTAIILPY